MSEMTMRGSVRAFCEAFLAADTARIDDWLDDNVDWIVFGPVDLFPFFGQRTGKQAVARTYREITASLEIKSCERDSVLIDGDRASSMIRLTAVHRHTGRTLAMRLAYFADFRGPKVVRMRALLDSFDFAEQAIGREIDLTAAA
jgi:ketosteroid isomerase-like protein